MKQNMNTVSRAHRLCRPTDELGLADVSQQELLKIINRELSLALLMLPNPSTALPMPLLSPCLMSLISSLKDRMQGRGLTFEIPVFS